MTESDFAAKQPFPFVNSIQLQQWMHLSSRILDDVEAILSGECDNTDEGEFTYIGAYMRTHRYD